MNFVLTWYILKRNTFTLLHSHWIKHGNVNNVNSHNFSLCYKATGQWLIGIMWRKRVQLKKTPWHCNSVVKIEHLVISSYAEICQTWLLYTGLTLHCSKTFTWHSLNPCSVQWKWSIVKMCDVKTNSVHHMQANVMFQWDRCDLFFL